MSRAHGPQKPGFFPFGNPFRMMLPKGSFMSPELLELLNNFEQELADRLSKLMPKDNESVCSLSWMTLAMKLLSETHNAVKVLIDDLDLPLCTWEDKWIDVYLGSSVNLLDISIAFSSEISRLSQGQLLLQCLLHNLDCELPKDFKKARSSLDTWWQHIGSKNPRVENCSALVDQLVHSLDLPKIKKNLAKGKVLVQAMYGVRVQTILTCSVFISAFRGSLQKPIEVLNVPQTHLWADAYTKLQSSVDKELSGLKPGNILIKELGAVDESAKALLSSIPVCDEATESEALKGSISELKRRTESLSEGLDLLAKDVDGFFQIVLAGRDALLGKIRTGIVSTSPKGQKKESQMW